MKYLAALCGIFLSLPAFAVELYPATRAPGNGVNWTTTVSLVDADGVAVALASGDTELSCEGGALADTTEATSAAAGVATVTYDASTNSNCEFGTIVVKGANHVASVATVHFVTDYSLVFAATVSAYDDSTPTGCSPSGASLTLNTTDQVGSATDGTYNGLWVQPADGTGGNQNGQWASTQYTYDGTNKILCVDAPFVTALVGGSTVVHLYAGYTRSPITETSIASATVDEFETQSQADPTGFHVNVLEISGTAQTANDNGADINTLVTAVDAVPTAAENRAEMDSNSADLNSLMLARTQILVATADSGDTNTMVDTEATFANAEDVAGAYAVRSDGQRCFVDSFNPATDTYEFGACTFTGAWSTQAYKLYPAGTQ